jgi:antitoxin (DNA-binding transcriptional repressor) of toxin-antitoxin stability system
MAFVPVRELRNRTADVVARAQAGEEIIVTNHGVPTVRLEAVGAPRRQWLSRAEVLGLHQADAGLRLDLSRLAGDTTDDLGPLE